ncbi:MAG: phosphodiester glycosidase family protein [Gudongella sp.]|nr:phosphodiester glycosidase family protein [Gudongella sp.]
MKLNKVILTGLFSAALLFSSPLNNNAILATSLSPTILEDNQTTPIASGVVHNDIRRFTAEGWLSLDVIRIDLNDNYTEIGPLFHQDGLSKKTTVKGLVEQKNAVAGINGDFFNTTNISTSLGALIQNGELISSPNNLPTFFITENNEPKIDYMTKTMTIINNTSGRLLTIDTVNKLHANFETITLLNRNWGKTSIGSQFRNDLYEVLIQDGVVLDRHFGGDPFPIPQNDTGFVLTSKSMNLLDFNIGDKISYSIQSGPDWNSLKFAIGAGSIVLKDGVVTNTDVNITGLHPRTGLGITQDGKEVILVTVDGRDTYFKGVSQETLGAILKSLGAYNGINFDGGGSTMMAVKPLGQTSAVVVNKPSENRAVVNGVGVFSSAPMGNLNTMTLTKKKDNVFVGNSIGLELKGYDEYNNIFNVNINDINWSVSDNLGSVSNGVFIAKKAGLGTITASYNNISATTPVRVLGDPVEISLDSKVLNISPSGTWTLGSVYGVDADGYKDEISKSLLDISVVGNIGKFENGILKAGTNPATGAIVIKSGLAVKTIKVYVGTKSSSITSFENEKAIKFSGYPASVLGSAQLTNEAYKGNNGIEINYNFKNGTGTRAAYVYFTHTANGMLLPDEPLKLGLQVFGDNSNTWLRGTIIDALNQTYTIDFTKDVNFTEWKYLEANIPDGVSYPISLQRIYVAETNSEKFNEGSIVIDELTALSKLAFDNTNVPAETQFKDRLSKTSEISSSGFKVAVYNEPEISGNTLFTKIVSSSRLKGLTDRLSGAAVGIQLKYTNVAFKNSINHSQVVDGKSIFGTSKKGSIYTINLQADSVGIRSAGSKQWMDLVEVLNSVDETNIIITLNKPVFGSTGFSDKMEADLFQDFLVKTSARGKNIFVIQNGSSNDLEIIDGIRYLTLTQSKISTPEGMSNYSFIEFAVNGDDISYERVYPYSLR